MKSTPVIRRIDDLGRIVLPIDIRKKLNLSPRDPVTITYEDGKIVIGRYNATCDFCGAEEKLTAFGEGFVCSDCIDKIKKL